MERIDHVFKKVVNEISNNSIKEGMTGVPSGLLNFDRITDGFHGGELTVIASRPSMGKTSFLCTLVKNMSVDFDKSVLFLSLESKSSSIVNRLICSVTGFEFNKIRKGGLEPHEWEQLNVKTRSLTNASIYIEDEVDFSIDSLKLRIKKYLDEENKVIDIILVDYIQLLNLGKNKRQNREEELSIIVKELKLIAREYNVPIIITSQLSRNIETRGGTKRPLLYDIRDSGAIEDDADVVCFLYRPEHYGMTEWDDDDHSPCEGQAELIIAKNRTGKLDNIRLKFSPHLFKFDNLEESYSSEFISSINSFETDNGGGGMDDVPF